MKIGLKLILSAICLLNISCNNNSPIKRIERDIEPKLKNSMVKDVPLRMSTPTIHLHFHQNWVRILGITTLENGIEGFQLRIWEDLEKLNGRLIIIEHINKTWSAKECLYKYEAKDEESLLDSISGKITILKKPKSGWKFFLNKLLDLKILTLLDYESIPDYDIASDEKGIKVEIGYKNYYRYYDLPSANHRKVNISEAKMIVQILDLIKKNFPVDRNF